MHKNILFDNTCFRFASNQLNLDKCLQGCQSCNSIAQLLGIPDMKGGGEEKAVVTI